MPTLFDDDSEQEEVEKLNLNSSYAQNYSKWRQKEELNKLKTKYGENVVLDLGKNDDDNDDDDDESSSSSDEGEEVPEEFEKSFYKTLACLKNKDPRIYNENVTFFKDYNDKKEGDDSKKKKKEKAMTLRDYERHIIVDKGGKLSDSEDEKPCSSKFDKEDKEIMNSFKNALKDDDEDFFSTSKSDREDQKKKSYKEWLKGQSGDINEDEKKELNPLKKFWNNPKLDENEKFLRDYILENKYSDNYDSAVANEYNTRMHDSDIDLSEDERNINNQEEFEHKYNFRFEEPDEEFIKRYPRTLEGTFRKKDTKRAEKRAEVKARKEQEKLKKREELKQLKALKRKEIEEKLEKLKEITGNDDINLDVADLDGDFDPDDYDKKMSQMFNDDYYAQDKDEMKPEFPEIDEELDVEQNWDSYDPNSEVIVGGDSYHEGGADCEDPEFNMDADYNGQNSAQAEIESVKKRKRRRRSKFADMISKEKPKFDPKMYPKAQEYFDEYYALDYEDMIGDLPCRFKYRQTVPNDYGLTVEEILLADDRELNKWISLKRALQRKDDSVEYSDVKKYKQKAANEALKRKILPSLYKPIEEEENVQEKEKEENEENGENEEQKSTKKKRRRKKKTQENNEVISDDKVEDTSNTTVESKKNKKKRKHEESEMEHKNPEMSEKKGELENTINQSLAEQSSVNNKESKKKKKKGNATDQVNQSTLKETESSNGDEPQKKKKEQSEQQVNQSIASESTVNSDQVANKKKKKKKNNNKNIVQKVVKEGKKLHITDEFIQKISKEKGLKVLSKKKARKEIFKKRRKNKIMNEEAEKNPVLKIQNERLKAYGISNPSKFKNKLKYSSEKK